jgi:hypothetical protein
MRISFGLLEQISGDSQGCRVYINIGIEFYLLQAPQNLLYPSIGPGWAILLAME